MPKLLICSLPCLLAIAACGDRPVESGPGGVSAEDAKALDEAAEQLEIQNAHTQN